MSLRTTKAIAVLVVGAAVLATSGCGLFGFLDRRPPYEKSEPKPPLKVPSDLSKPSDDPSMDVPPVDGVPGPVGDVPRPPDLDDSALPQVAKVELPKDSGGAPYLPLKDTVDSAWRRTGLALERSGFTILERDEARRLYSVRYHPPPEKKKKDGGFFHWLFGGDDDKPDTRESARYQVSVVGAGEEETRLMVLNSAGSPEATDAAERILSLLADRLKS